MTNPRLILMEYIVQNKQLLEKNKRYREALKILEEENKYYRRQLGLIKIIGTDTWNGTEISLSDEAKVADKAIKE